MLGCHCCHCCLVQVEGDTAKLSDSYFAVQALTHHVQKLASVQGTYTNMLLDDDMPASTLALAHAFAASFKEAWEPRARSAQSNIMVATAILDPR
jgi:hypothetical protein